MVAAALPDRLILYDGVCGFCNRAVGWVLRADRAGRFRFATLQGPTAAAILARHPELAADVDSILYVRQDDGREAVSSRCDAVFAICAELPGWWRACSWLRWLPRRLTDPAYRYFAAHRYRWFGKYDKCPSPSPAQRDRFRD